MEPVALVFCDGHACAHAYPQQFSHLQKMLCSSNCAVGIAIHVFVFACVCVRVYVCAARWRAKDSSLVTSPGSDRGSTPCTSSEGTHRQENCKCWRRRRRCGCRTPGAALWSQGPAARCPAHRPPHHVIYRHVTNRILAPFSAPEIWRRAMNNQDDEAGGIGRRWAELEP